MNTSQSSVRTNVTIKLQDIFKCHVVLDRSSVERLLRSADVENVEQRLDREEEIIYLSLASLDEEDAVVKAPTYLNDPKHIFRKFAIDFSESD